MTSLFKIVFLFPFIICFHFKAYSKNPCHESFTEPDASALSRAEGSTRLDTFALSMTEGLRLGKEQEDLFDLYRQIYFGGPHTSSLGSLQRVNSILQKYPELSKLPVREQYIIFEEKIHEIPQSLTDFVRHFRNSANRVRNNLFNIYENLGFWRQVLSYPKMTIDSSLSKREKTEIKRRENERFLEYLEQFIDEKVLKIITDPTKDNVEKTVFMYKTLNAIREAMLTDGKDTRYISQAMVDLIHFAGFGNLLYTNMLKSGNPREQVEGINKILSERDSIAFLLGFENHFSELKQSLNVNYPIGSTKGENLAKVLRNIERDIENMPYTSIQTSVLRVRPLSLQESPFRSCVGGSDCSSYRYFEKALDPNFLYFTITDKNHNSSGHITVVLGEAKDKDGRMVKIAFIDKMQNVPNEKILPMLESIRLSLREQGYKLGLPKDVGDINGLSNENLTRNYVQSEINPVLNILFTDFKPHENRYSFHNEYSRAYSKSDLLEFELVEHTNFRVESGEIKQAQNAPKDLDVQSLFVEVLSLQFSEKEEDQIKFITNLIDLNKVKGLDLSYPQNKPDIKTHRRQNNHGFTYNYLIQKIDDPKNSFKLRKTAFWTLVEFLYKNNKVDYSEMILNTWEKFSEEEQNLLFGEMSNWKKSRDLWKNNFIKNLSSHFFYGILSKDAEVFLKHKLIRLVINLKDQYTKNAFLVATDRGDTGTIEIPMGKFYALYITSLMIAANYSLPKTTDKLVITLLDSWNKFSEEEQTLLLNEMSNWTKWDRWKNNFIGKLSSYFSDGILSKDVNFFLENTLIRLFTDFKDGYVTNAFMAAADRGDIETVDFFIKKGIDIHIDNKFIFGSLYATALITAVDSGRTETVELLIKNGADINNHFYGDPLLNIAANNGHVETVELLIKSGVDIHHANNNGTTALSEAARNGHTETVEFLIKNGADIHHVANDGTTALSEAARNGHTETVKLLIKNGADRKSINLLRYYFLMVKALIF